MHVDGVEATTASMIVQLPLDGSPTVWALTGSPCKRDYTRFQFDEAGAQDLAAV